MNNLYATFDTIDPSYILAGCKQRLGIKNSTDDDLYLLDLINEGAKEIRSPLSFVPAIATLQIVNGKAKLPVGFVRFAKGAYPIRFVGANGQINNTNLPSAPIFLNNEFYTDNPFQDFANLQPFGGVVNMVEGYLYFEGNEDATYCKIAYLSTRLDVQGNVLIPAVAERVVTAYACWKYNLTIKDYNAAMMFAEEYKRGKSGLKGKFNLTESYEMPYLTYLVNKIP